MNLPETAAPRSSTEKSGAPCCSSRRTLGSAAQTWIFRGAQQRTGR